LVCCLEPTSSNLHTPIDIKLLKYKKYSSWAMERHHGRISRQRPLLHRTLQSSATVSQPSPIAKYNILAGVRQVGAPQKVLIQPPSIHPAVRRGLTHPQPV